jgi:hypothetical protein
MESWFRLSPFAKIGELTIPWIVFIALLAWGWRVYDMFHAIPYYGDVLEVVWGIAWYGDHLLDGQLFYFPRIFQPEGWQVAVFGYGPGMFIPLLPLYKLGGAAFAYNAAVLVSFFIAFAGMHNLARRVACPSSGATLASLLFTFWGFRWLRINGHLNILIGSALLPWMVWCLERGLHSPRKSRRWFVVVGMLWAIASASSFYFILIGGLVLVGCVAGRFLSHQINWRMALRSGLISTFVAALLNLPALLFFVKGNQAAASPFYDIFYLSAHGASLNSIPIPYVFHPWLDSLARWLYQGPRNESGVGNFGFAASVFALIGLRRAHQDKNALPALLLTGIGLMLALGFTLKWDDRPIEWDVLGPVNALVWSLAHRLRPGFFPSGMPPIPFDNAILMPGLMLAVLVPFVEGVRVLSRYALVAAIGFFLLVSKEVGRLTLPFARVIVGTLLILQRKVSRCESRKFGFAV